MLLALADTHIRIFFLFFLSLPQTLSRMNTPLSKFTLMDSGVIEEDNALQVDFANKFIGGGVLGCEWNPVSPRSSSCSYTSRLERRTPPWPHHGCESLFHMPSAYSLFLSSLSLFCSFPFFFAFSFFFVVPPPSLSFPLSFPVGCVQEEIRFVISPECLVSMLLCERMRSSEAIVIRGVEVFSETTGYGRTFKYKGPVQVSERDGCRVRNCGVRVLRVLRVWFWVGKCLSCSLSLSLFLCIGDVCFCRFR